MIFQYGEERYSRRIARAIVEPRGTRRRSRPRVSWRRSSAGRSRSAAISASIRRRGRSRRCASGSTASSKGSSVPAEAACDRLLGRRAAGHHHVPLARGSDREACVPGARRRAGARAAHPDQAPARAAGGRSRSQPARAQRQAPRDREAGMSPVVTRFRVRDQEGRPEQSDRPRGRRGAAAGSCGARRHRRGCSWLVAAVLGLADISSWSGTATTWRRSSGERAAEEEMNRHLRLEIETLRSPQRIEEHGHQGAAARAPARDKAIVIERVTPPAPPDKSIVALRALRASPTRQAGPGALTNSRHGRRNGASGRPAWARTPPGRSACRSSARLARHHAGRGSLVGAVAVRRSGPPASRRGWSTSRSSSTPT